MIKPVKKIHIRKEDSHKGDFGKVLVVAGSTGMTGAAYLTSYGAIRSGGGLVTCCIPESLNTIMEIKLTEVMTLPVNETKMPGYMGLRAKKTILDFAAGCDAVAIGPGLGGKEETRKLIRELIRKIECPIVIDADGINALAGNTAILKKRKGRTIITPHPGEMARLINKETSYVQLQRVETAKTVARENGIVVCLKGHKTVVTTPEGQIFVNDTGNSGMATGGTGDVLTGMIASFLGQGIDDFSAATSAVYLHGLAGDIAADKLTQFSMTAGDIIDYLPLAFKKSGL
jgi:ADP-dependent NAD(P)H-hydrate dehydratase / NAD(P)H-hydrate epimerase